MSIVRRGFQLFTFAKKNSYVTCSMNRTLIRQEVLKDYEQLNNSG